MFAPSRTYTFLAPALSFVLVSALAPEVSAAPTPGDPTSEGSASASGSASLGGGGGRAGARTAAAMGGNRFRLSVDGEFLGWAHSNPDGGADDDGRNMFGFGIGRGISNQVEAGTDTGGTPLMGLGFGVVIMGGRAIVGARAGVAMGSSSNQGSDDRDGTLGGELIPYFRFLFMEGTIRPYVEGHMGVAGARGKAHRQNVDGDDVWDAGHVITPVIGAGGGAMFFLNPHVSVDVGLNFDFMSLHSRSTHSSNQDVENSDWSKDRVLVSLTAVTGISAWF